MFIMSVDVAMLVVVGRSEHFLLLRQRNSRSLFLPNTNGARKTFFSRPSAALQLALVSQFLLSKCDGQCLVAYCEDVHTQFLFSFGLTDQLRKACKVAPLLFFAALNAPHKNNTKPLSSARARTSTRLPPSTGHQAKCTMTILFTRISPLTNAIAKRRSSSRLFETANFVCRRQVANWKTRARARSCHSLVHSLAYDAKFRANEWHADARREPRRFARRRRKTRSRCLRLFYTPKSDEVSDILAA